MKFFGSGPIIGKFNPRENIMFKNRKNFLTKLRKLKSDGLSNLGKWLIISLST